MRKLPLALMAKKVAVLDYMRGCAKRSLLFFLFAISSISIVAWKQTARLLLQLCDLSVCLAAKCAEKALFVLCLARVFLRQAAIGSRSCCGTITPLTWFVEGYRKFPVFDSVPLHRLLCCARVLCQPLRLYLTHVEAPVAGHPSRVGMPLF